MEFCHVLMIRYTDREKNSNFFCLKKEPAISIVDFSSRFNARAARTVHM